MLNMHTLFLFCFGNVVGSDGSVAQDGVQGSPLLTTPWGWVLPQFYNAHELPPLDYHIPRRDT